MWKWLFLFHRLEKWSSRSVCSENTCCVRWYMYIDEYTRKRTDTQLSVKSILSLSLLRIVLRMYVNSYPSSLLFSYQLKMNMCMWSKEAHYRYSHGSLLSLSLSSLFFPFLSFASKTRRNRTEQNSNHSQHIHWFTLRYQTSSRTKMMFTLFFHVYGVRSMILFVRCFIWPMVIFRLIRTILVLELLFRSTYSSRTFAFSLFFLALRDIGRYLLWAWVAFYL